MTRIFILFCLTLPLLANAQSKELLNESFDNNFHKWSTPDRDEYSRHIGNGKMKLVSKSAKFFWGGIGVPVNKKKDLKIEAVLSFTKFKKGEAGIMWGCSDDYKKLYAFTISPDGTFNFGKWAPLFQSVTGSLRTNAINRELGATNKITMVKEGRKMRLLVNDVQVYDGSFPSMYGTEVGLVAGGGSVTAEVESLVMIETEKN